MSGKSAPPIKAKNPIQLNSNGEIQIIGATYAWSGSTKCVDRDTAKAGTNTSDGAYIGMYCQEYLPLMPKVWMSYDQTSNTILDSFNVGSVTDSAAGFFTMHYLADLTEAYYTSFVGGTINNGMTTQSGGADTFCSSVGNLQVNTWNSAGAKTDWPYVSVAILGRHA